MEYTPSFEEFEKNVKNHVMRINLDQGLVRDITFHNPNSSAFHFNITTRPDYLIFSGDMGTFVFKRIEDMLSFFRPERDTPTINPSYWHEKLVACPENGAKQFSKERLIRILDAELNETIQSIKEDDLQNQEFLNDNPDNKELTLSNEALESINQANEAFEKMKNFDDEYELRRYIYNSNPTKTLDLDYLNEFDFKDYDYHFIWCCRALMFAAEKYFQQIQEANEQ